MRYGCIGEHLKHSFSKEIHAAFADYEYEIREIERDALADFARARAFKAINVTIPYKELIMPYLDGIEGVAREIGAVNTVVNRDGRLYGYNTDFYGMSRLIRHAGITVKDKKVVILGTGGTSKTALAAVGSLGARCAVRVSRTARHGAVSYDELYEKHADAEIIINTTPCGMFPSIFDTPVDISRFTRLSGVIDAVYNPLRTPLVSEARRRGIAAEGGLYMLVAQAIRASEIFTGTEYPEGEADRVYEKIFKSKENIVLCGMPASGKSTVGKILAARYGREFTDTDLLVEEREGESISEIFARRGERYFREAEKEIIREVSAKSGAVIATGGGAVIDPENVAALKENGRIYFIDRPLDALIPTDDRPLASTREDIEKRYRERYGIYTDAADEAIRAECDADGVADRIERSFGI